MEETKATPIPSQRENDSPEDSDAGSPPQLSAHALAALQEFYAEEAALEAQLKLGEGVAPQLITEDWQLSQFWYDETTAGILAGEALRASHNKRIACVSCPTLFTKLLDIKPSDVEVMLLEYDRRFEVYGDCFCYYDYNNPLNLSGKLVEHSFGLVVADPPFLSEECLRKTAETVKYLASDKIILCTGAVMESLALELLDLRVCTSFIPRHTRNLANEFRCYSNYKTSLDSSSKIETKKTASPSD